MTTGRIGLVVTIGMMALGCASSSGSDDSDRAGVPATSMNPGTGVTMPNTPIDSQTPGTNTTPADTMNAGSTGTMTGGSGNTGTPTDTGMNGTSPQPMMNDPMNNANPMNPMPAQPCPEGQERIEGVCQAVDSPMADESGLDLAGNYILQTNVTTIQSTPLGDQTSVTTLHGYLNITADGSGGWTSTEYGCGGGSSTDGGVNISISQSLSETIPERVMPFRAFSAGGMNRFSRSEAAVAIGIMLANPLQESLPMDTADPRIFDQDMDGQPGITVDVTVEGALAGLLGGADHKIYVMQINRNSMSGTIEADGSLKGTLVDRSEQRILGASNAILQMDLPARPGPDPSANTFRAFKVDNAAIDCTWVNANKGSYF